MRSVTETGQFINAQTAHQEWANRPADERYQSLVDLAVAADTQRRRSIELVQPIHADTVQAIDGRLVLDLQPGHALAHNGPIGMTSWAFQQLCHDGGAPSAYLKTLPADVAADCLRHGLQAYGSDTDRMLYVDEDAGTLRAVTSPKYSRLHNAAIADRLVDMQESHPEWKLPMGYANGEWGAPLVPSGAYLSDRDLFIMLIDGNRAIEDITDSTQQGLFRGVIVRNSDVGAAALTVDFFYFRAVCGNNIIWGMEHAIGIRRRHVGAEMPLTLENALITAENRLLSSASEDENWLRRAQSNILGSDKPEVVAAVAKFMSKKTAEAAYDVAAQREPNPNSAWGFVQGLTAISQQTPHANVRWEADRAASDVLRAFAS
jgi:hypothetical protein